MSNAILTENISDALVVRFNRPEIRNPLSVSVLESVLGILEETAEDRSVRKVVFTGTEGVFASGADLREIANITSSDAAEFARRGQSLMAQIAGTSAETIAAINGPCFGGALDLALACDRRIAVPAATFCHPGAGLGIITGWGGTQRLSRLIGRANALEMFFPASPISAARALEIGLIDAIADDPVSEALR